MRGCGVRSVREREIAPGRVCTPPHHTGMLRGIRATVAETGTMASGMTEKGTGTGTAAAGITDTGINARGQHQGAGTLRDASNTSNHCAAAALPVPFEIKPLILHSMQNVKAEQSLAKFFIFLASR